MIRNESLLLSLSFATLLISTWHVHGFTCSPDVARHARYTSANRDFLIYATSSSFHDSTVEHQSSWPSRRDALLQSLTTIAIAALSTLAISPMNPAMATSQARVAVWPGLEYLEPVYELQLSVTALAQAIPDTTKWPYLQQRLDKFFSGGLFSERNYYAGLGVQYMNQVQYDKNELPEYIKLDKEERFQSMEAALQAMEVLKTHLSSPTPTREDDVAATKALLKSDVDQVQASLNRWFGLVPKQDVERVAQLYVAVRGADVDRNGRIDDQEIATLSDEDRAVWKKRIDYVGG